MIERSGFQQVLIGTGADLAVQFYSGDVAADPGSVTVTVTDLDGSTVTEDEPATGSGTGTRTVTLTPAETNELTTFTARWTGTVSGVERTVTTRAEVIGDHLFGLAEAREFGKKKLQNQTTVPDAVIERARARILDDFQKITGVAFVPRYRLVTLDGDDPSPLDLYTSSSTSNILILPDLYPTAIRSVATRGYGSTTWETWTGDDLALLFLDESGVLHSERRWFPVGQRNIRIGYEYGMSYVPETIRFAALAVVSTLDVPNNTPDRARIVTQDGISYTMAMPGENATTWYGIPAVDRVLADFQRRTGYGR